MLISHVLRILRPFPFMGMLSLGFIASFSWGESSSHLKDLPSATPPPKDTPLIRSSIEFREGSAPWIRYAGIELPDVLRLCPIESMPSQVLELLNLLAGKVKGSISRMAQTGGAQCEALEKRLLETNNKVAQSITNQWVTGVTQTQAQINQATQQAAATNELVLTVSDLFQSQCINTQDDRMVVQKILAQLVTLGGIFSGGWQGTAAASGGQLLGALPLFPSDADKALAVFRAFEEKQERASFLCIYRQMQKTDCLLFTTPENSLIQGIDFQGEVGPYSTTRAAIEKIKKDSPTAFAEVVQLSELTRSGKSFISIMEQSNALAQGSIEGFLALKKWCLGFPAEVINTLERYSPVLRDNLVAIGSSCSSLNEYTWENARSPRMIQFLFDSYWQLKSLDTFYQSLMSSSDKFDLEYIVSTWESLRYFENLIQSFKKAQDPLLGNQFRINYHNLVTRLGESLAKKSFRSLMKENYSTWRHIFGIRPRALVAQLNLCQTLDPTLACLYLDHPWDNKLQIEWNKWCVGPKSHLCKSVKNPKDLEILLTNPSDRAYFDSLCGS